MMNNTWLVGGLAALVALMAGCSDDSGTTSMSTSTSASSSSSGAGGNAGAGGGGGDAGSGGDGGQGGFGEQSVNGCLSTMAEDQVNQNQLPMDWANPHHRCAMVATTTVVSWTGDFTLHPLAGGEVVGGVGMEDVGSDISMVDQSGTTAGIILSTPGVYPYFCKNHAPDMNGVIYVVEAGSGGAGGN